MGERLRFAGKKLRYFGEFREDKNGCLYNLIYHFLGGNREDDLWSLIGNLSPSVLGQMISAGHGGRESEFTSIDDAYPFRIDYDPLYHDGPVPKRGMEILQELACSVIIARIWDILVERLRK